MSNCTVDDVRNIWLILVLGAYAINSSGSWSTKLNSAFSVTQACCKAVVDGGYSFSIWFLRRKAMMLRERERLKLSGSGKEPDMNKKTIIFVVCRLTVHSIVWIEILTNG